MSAKQEECTKTIDVSDQGNAPDSASRKHDDSQRESIKCPSCGYSFITKTDGKCKLRTRILVFAENGNTMGICPKCRTSLKVPVSLCSRPVAEKPIPAPTGSEQAIPLKPRRAGNR